MTYFPQEPSSPINRPTIKCILRIAANIAANRVQSIKLPPGNMRYLHMISPARAVNNGFLALAFTGVTPPPLSPDADAVAGNTFFHLISTVTNEIHLPVDCRVGDNATVTVTATNANMNGATFCFEIEPDEKGYGV